MFSCRCAWRGRGGIRPPASVGGSASAPATRNTSELQRSATPGTTTPSPPSASHIHGTPLKRHSLQRHEKSSPALANASPTPTPAAARDFRRSPTSLVLRPTPSRLQPLRIAGTGRSGGQPSAMRFGQMGLDLYRTQTWAIGCGDRFWREEKKNALGGADT